MIHLLAPQILILLPASSFPFLELIKMQSNTFLCAYSFSILLFQFTAVSMKSGTMLVLFPSDIHCTAQYPELYMKSSAECY